MKSGKQRRQEIIAKRKKKLLERAILAKSAASKRPPERLVSVNEAALAPSNSYGAPDFVRRGYYVDIPFRCKDCGKEEIWTGAQQKWWYEVAKGFVYSTAILCRVCRRKDQERRKEARRIHFEGVARKQSETK